MASSGPDDARVLCRSALPYTLDLVLHAVTRELPVLEVEVSGDLAGSVRFTVTEEAGGPTAPRGRGWTSPRTSWSSVRSRPPPGWRGRC